MNLDGIRMIKGGQVLIEPSTSSAGWTALFLRNTHDIDWTRSPLASFRSLWIEVTGSGVDYNIDQYGGRVNINLMNSNNPAAKHRLWNNGIVTYSGRTFSGNSSSIQNYFVFEDYTCHAIIENCNARNLGTALNDPRFTFVECSYSPGGGADPQTGTSFNNLLSSCLWKYDGGFLDSNMVTFSNSGTGTLAIPTTDATYGRALLIRPNAGNVNAIFQAHLRNAFPQGGQLFVLVRGTLPTISGGNLELSLIFNGAFIGESRVYTPANSGQQFLEIIPITAQSANPTGFGFIFVGPATTDIKITQAEIWAGKSIPCTPMPIYPNKVRTYASAVPTVGTWAQGDSCDNTDPTAAGIPGWVCTAAGSPGTWKAMASLAA
jgi:hypothetical protein